MPFTKGTGIENDPARLASWRKRHAMSLRRKYKEMIAREAIRQEKQDMKIAAKMQKKLSGFPYKMFHKPSVSPFLLADTQPMRSIGPFSNIRKTGKID